MTRNPRATRFDGKWMVAAIFVCAQFMDIMDTTIVNVALPGLARDFHASTSDIEWVVLGYLVALAASIPASGWLGDRFGTKRIFLFALAMFTVASALCGQSQNLTELVLFRVLQGVGGGMLVPVGTAMLFRAFPPIERARVSTILLVPTILAPAIGPILGGWLVTYHSWRWIFYVNLPIGVIAFVMGVIYLHEYRDPHAGAFDRRGFVLSAVALSTLLYALSQGPEKGWLSGSVVITAVTGTIMLIALIKVELSSPEPMLALRLYRDKMFRLGNNIMGLMYGTFASVLFILPLYLQRLRGLSAFDSGLTTFPQAVGVMTMGQLVGRIYHRVGPRRLVTCGLAGLFASTLPLAFVGLHTDLWTIRTILFVRGCCTAFVAVPLQASLYANISPADTGRASALFSAQRQVCAGLGVAALATVLLEWSGGASVNGTGSMGGFHAAFAGASLLLAGAFVVALRIRDADAASTMRPRVRRRDDAALAVAE
jgi:EmrB/QacA subfamily drug resistance transporter